MFNNQQIDLLWAEYYPKVFAYFYKQTSIQVCGPLRANLVLKDPEITKQRLDEVCPLE
jgi:hypothetical protein